MRLVNVQTVCHLAFFSKIPQNTEIFCDKVLFVINPEIFILVDNIPLQSKQCGTNDVEE